MKIQNPIDESDEKNYVRIAKPISSDCLETMKRTKHSAVIKSVSFSISIA
jgi:hypothetical protein